MNSASTLRVREVDFKVDPRWNSFVSLHQDGLIYHHTSYLSALESEYGQRCRALICEDSSAHVRAVLPLFHVEGLPFRLGRSTGRRRLSSLPRTPVAGPLATDDAAMAAILQHALQLVRGEAGLHLEIKSTQSNLERLAPELCCMPWNSSYVQELPAGIDGASWENFCEDLRLPRECGPCEDCRRLRFGNAKKQHRVNWAVNKALRLGLHIREANNETELAQWYRLYLDSMRHHSFPPRPFRFFANLWSALRPLGQVKLLFAESTDTTPKRIVAGSMVLQFGQTAFYAFTGCAHKDFSLHPHDLLQLHLIRDSCRSGFRWYDFGEVSEGDEGLAQFKGKWGTQARQLYRYFYPALQAAQSRDASSLISWVRRGWPSLPLGITEKLGDKIHRYT
jgi:hypothetical protein